MAHTKIWGIVLALCLIVMLASCTSKEGQKIALTPFIGGTAGLTIDFVDFRTDVFDSGGDPFDITVKLTNAGETQISKDDVLVKITGIKPQEFNKMENDMQETASETILANTKSDAGQVVPSPPIFVEFKNFNHVTPITGSSLDFPIRAEVCYSYVTQAVSKLCVRDSIINPKTGGLCEIEESKPVYNSGAPVQVENVKETAGGQNKIRFSFDIRHVGTGSVFEPKTKCAEPVGQNQKLKVQIDTQTPGLECTGLDQKTGTAVYGITQLFDNVKTITCTQEITALGNYEQPLVINVFYDYDDFKSTDLTVKHTGEVTTPTTTS